MNRILAFGAPSPGTARVRLRPRGHFWQALTSRASSASASMAVLLLLGEDNIRSRRIQRRAHCNRVAGSQGIPRRLRRAESLLEEGEHGVVELAGLLERGHPP